MHLQGQLAACQQELQAAQGAARASQAVSRAELQRLSSEASQLRGQLAAAQQVQREAEERAAAAAQQLRDQQRRVAALQVRAQAMHGCAGLVLWEDCRIEKPSRFAFWLKWGAPDCKSCYDCQGFGGGHVTRAGRISCTP
jgi:hypothetical protein